MMLDVACGLAELLSDFFECVAFDKIKSQGLALTLGQGGEYLLFLADAEHPVDCVIQSDLGSRVDQFVGHLIQV